MNPERKPNPALIAVIVIVLLALAAGAVYAATRPTDDATEQTTSETASNTPAATDSSSDTTGAAYSNGTYEATGSYSTPGGRESVDLTVTIDKGIITTTDISGSGTSGEALEYQTKFISNYKPMVVGKSIDEVSLSRVAGSSLTSNGFNDALDQIKLDAKA